jgi:hypothetical protein
MRNVASVTLLVVSLLLILTACDATKHVKLGGVQVVPVPKPCRISSTKATCMAYLIRSLTKSLRGGSEVVFQTATVPASVKLCPNRLYPALCNKR